MKKRLTISLGMAMLLVAPTWVLAQGNSPDLRAKSKELAKLIDKIINERLAEEEMTPGSRADLGRLARRLHIDLTGRIPTVVEFHDLVDASNNSPTKYEDRVEHLLTGNAYSANFTHYLRSIILGGGNQNIVQNQIQFDTWLRSRLATGVPYDVMVREVLTSQGVPGAPNVNQNPNVPGGSPVAFYQVNQGVENQTGAAARVFMGVKIECAQCHPHPFAQWKQTQFWEMAAFFQNNNNPTIKIPLTEKFVKARFLTGEEPDMKNNTSLRRSLAEWMTTKSNPYFSRAGVDHIWQYFFGVSLIEPIFEGTVDSPPAHKKLLDTLADAFADSGFDIKFLIRAIVLSEAYQRVSVPFSEKTKIELQMFAKMPVRGMMPEQLFDCICVATNLRQADQPTGPQGPKGLNNNPQNNQQKQQFLQMFNSQDKRIEAQTSILQALYMMNGPFVQQRYSHPLETIGIQNTTTQRKIEAIYMLTLSRMPTASEMTKMVSFVEGGGGSGDSRQAVADVCWALLNSSEFLLNH